MAKKKKVSKPVKSSRKILSKKKAKAKRPSKKPVLAHVIKPSFPEPVEHEDLSGEPEITRPAVEDPLTELANTSEGSSEETTYEDEDSSSAA